MRFYEREKREKREIYSSPFKIQIQIYLGPISVKVSLEEEEL